MKFIFYFVFLRWFIRILFCSQTDPVETLYISIEGDFSNLLAGADQELAKAKSAAAEIGGATEKAGDSVKELGDEISKTGKQTKEWTQEAVKAGDATENLGDDATDTGNKVKGLGSIFSSAVKAVSNFFSRASSGADKAGKASGRARDKLGRFIKTSEETGGKGAAGAAKLGAAFGAAAGAAGLLLDTIVNIASSAAQAILGLGTEALNLASDLEQVQLTFTNIFKDEGKANKFLQDLQGEANKLGVSFNEASQFAKSLFPDTSGQEQFNELLRVAAIGAADAGLGLNELIFAFNEAVSGDFVSIRDRLDIPKDVIERVKEAPDIVSGLTEELDKLFEKRGVSNLEAAASTFQGLKRQISGFREGLLQIAGTKILVPIREGLQKIVDIIKEYGPSLNNVAEQLGEIVAIVFDFAKEEIFGAFDQATVFRAVKSLQAFVEQLKVVVRAGLAFIKQLKSYITTLFEVRQFFISLLQKALQPFADVLTKIGQSILSVVQKAVKPFVDGLNQVREAIGLGKASFEGFSGFILAGANAIAIIQAAIKGLITAFAPLGEVVSLAGKALFAFITGDFKGAAEAGKAAIGKIKEGVVDIDAGIKAAGESLKQSITDIERIANPVKEIKEDLEKPIEVGGDGEPEVIADEAVLSKIDSLTDQMIDATEKRNEQLIELEESHAEKIDEIAADAAEKRLEIQKDADEALIKNDQETEEKRLKVIEDARTKLSKLGEETNRELENRRDEFQKDELRDTEDHMKAMRQLTDNFLSSLQDAVRDRDARAVVDLQANFQREQSEREEDFNVNQSRGQEDQDQELATIRETEAQKRNEILASQTEELAQLQSHNEQKRAEIIAEREQELADLDISTQERIAKENEAFAERQAQLDQALQKQLESIAENLAKQKDVTAEGAQAILETLNETFGVGGDIDSLMENFAKRRSVRADIKIDFETRSGVKPKEEEPAPLTPIERIRSGLAAPGGRRLGGVQEFAEGGTLLASQPTLALFGEAGPEVVQFTPMADLSSPGGGEPGRMIIEMTGSAPPGIGSGDRDAIAGVLLTALRDTGALAQ